MSRILAASAFPTSSLADTAEAVMLSVSWTAKRTGRRSVPHARQNWFVPLSSIPQAGQYIFQLSLRPNNEIDPFRVSLFAFQDLFCFLQLCFLRLAHGRIFQVEQFQLFNNDLRNSQPRKPLFVSGNNVPG